VPQDKCHPQTIAVCQSRADGLGLKVVVSDEADFNIDKDVSGILLQYPATDGSIHDYKASGSLILTFQLVVMADGSCSVSLFCPACTFISAGTNA
jgi:glycine cleavage system pyridoxal-binding protein P